MAVRVVKENSTIKFYPDSPADHDLSDYLCGLVNSARSLAASADPSIVAKAGLTGIALIRKETEDRIRVLKDIADREDVKSRRTDLSWEIRELANRRAFAAKDEMRKLATELEGR